MNIIQLTALLKKPELWRPKSYFFSDALELKDGSLWFFANESVCFRAKDHTAVYPVPFWFFPWTYFLGHRLLKKVKRAEEKS